MPSSYPDAYDDLPARTDASPATPNAHAQDHTDERAAIVAVEHELGLAPSGSSATVAARLDALDTTVAGKASSAHAASHASGGSDAITIAESQVTNLTTDLAAKLAKASNLSDVASVATSRSNLGLGDSATKNVGTTAGTVAAGDDARLSDTRTPKTHASSHAAAGTDPISISTSQVSGLGTAATKDVAATGDASSAQVVKGDDSRLSDSRTPSAHAASHASGGSDAITIAESQVTNLTTDLAAKLAKASNLSDVANVATSRSNLGLAIGTNVQAWDADLDAFSALTAGGIVSHTTTSGVFARTITGGTGLTVTNGDGVAGDPTLALSQGLQDISGISRSKGDLITGSASAWARTAVGTNGQMLTADSAATNGVAWRSYLSQSLKFQADDYWLLSRSTGATGYAATSTGSSVANSNNVAVYCPFSISEEISVKALALHLVATNPGASAVVRMGIYNADASTGRPSTVVVDAGTTSLNASNVKELTFTSVTLKPGFYFYVVATQSLDTSGSANPTFSGCASSGSFQGAQESTPSASNNLYPTWTSSNITGAFASNPTLVITRGLAAKIFHVWAKVA